MRVSVGDTPKLGPVSMGKLGVSNDVEPIALAYAQAYAPCGRIVIARSSNAW
jgi:hypothetical protein